MTEVLVITACIVTLFLLVTRAIRRRYTDDYMFHRRIASRAKLDAMAAEVRMSAIVPVVIVDEHGKPVDQGS
jgi:hypothetical protein